MNGNLTTLVLVAPWLGLVLAGGTSYGPATSGATAVATESDVEITRAGSEASVQGPAEYFSGSVRIESLFQADAPARVGGAMVHFQPGARTAWHTHPLGQTLVITRGTGWVQREGGEVRTVHPGDVVWIPPHVRHWHGASATVPMSHLAVAESLDGSAVTWMEHVTDEQYARGELARPQCSR